MAGWRKHLPAIEAVARRTGRPVLFTGVGYRNSADDRVVRYDLPVGLRRFRQIVCKVRNLLCECGRIGDVALIAVVSLCSLGHPNLLRQSRYRVRRRCVASVSYGIASVPHH